MGSAPILLSAMPEATPVVVDVPLPIPAAGVVLVVVAVVLVVATVVLPVAAVVLDVPPVPVHPSQLDL